MGTVDKALSLLELFTADAPEHGLSDVSRLSNFDKATTLRLLTALAARGLVEQDSVSRKFRLGPGLLRLARLRETHFPFLQTSVPIVRALASETGETAHLSERNGAELVTVHVEETAKANRVGVTIGKALPLHATASGIAMLAFSEPDLLNSCLRRSLATFTRHTITDKAGLRAAVRAAASNGYSRGHQGYEDGVASVAAPIIGTDGLAVGTIAVASPLSRVDDAIIESHVRSVMASARTLSLKLFGASVPTAKP